MATLPAVLPFLLDGVPAGIVVVVFESRSYALPAEPRSYPLPADSRFASVAVERNWV